MKITLVVIGAIVLVIALSFLTAIPTMYLWNGLMPELFGLRQIDFWQAFGLCLLARFIFGAGGYTSKD